MKEDRIKKLNNELKYLIEQERQKEIINYNTALENNSVNIKDIAKDIYMKRGIDYSKLNKGVFNNLIDTISEFFNVFKNKDSKIKGKMVIEIIYIILILLLIKIPFDLVRDLGYDYLEILSKNNLYYNIWNFAFLLLYTITLICVLVVLIRNFNNKYRNIEKIDNNPLINK